MEDFQLHIPPAGCTCKNDCSGGSISWCYVYDIPTCLQISTSSTAPPDGTQSGFWVECIPYGTHLYLFYHIRI